MVPKARAYGFRQQPCLVRIHSVSQNRIRDSVLKRVEIGHKKDQAGGMFDLITFSAHRPAGRAEAKGEWDRPIFDTFELSLHTARITVALSASQFFSSQHQLQHFKLGVWSFYRIL